MIEEFREGRLMEYKRQRNKLYNCYLTRQETHIQIHIYSQLIVDKHRETDIKTERYIGTHTRREQKHSKERERETDFTCGETAQQMRQHFTCGHNRNLPKAHKGKHSLLFFKNKLI